MTILIFTSLDSQNSINDISKQKENRITDFYEYVNSDWLIETKISENGIVVNNWGILWDKITEKSIEILSGNTNYDLDEEHLFVLEQMQNFYQSASLNKQYSDERKRVALIQKQYPMLFGILFSEITISDEKEKQINIIINYLKDAYLNKIVNNDKIGNHYREFFLEKLSTMKFEIGAPKLSSFPKISKNGKATVKKNIEVAREYQLQKITSGCNTGWNSPPFETHCFYNFHDNKIKIYAGILYDSHYIEADDFVFAFATIGRTIGHEMTHAFDNVGQNFDKNGNYVNWFEKLFSGALFGKNDLDKTYDSLIKQFNRFTIQDSLHIDGRKTLQENFADLGGVEVSLLALNLFIEDNLNQLCEEDILKMKRYFYIYYAQFWREKATPEFERSTLNRAHTPQKFRLIGPIYNQNEFYDFFEIDKNTEYYIPKNKRISIW